MKPSVENLVLTKIFYLLFLKTFIYLLINRFWTKRSTFLLTCRQKILFYDRGYVLLVLYSGSVFNHAPRVRGSTLDKIEQILCG